MPRITLPGNVALICTVAFCWPAFTIRSGSGDMTTRLWLYVILPSCSYVKTRTVSLDNAALQIQYFYSKYLAHT